MAPRTTAVRKSLKILQLTVRNVGTRSPRWHVMVKQNGSWKGGTSAHYYRRKANAGKGEVVHHKNKGKHTAKNARRSNLQKVTPAKHNKLHPEKGRKAAAAGGNVPRKVKTLVLVPVRNLKVQVEDYTQMRILKIQ